MNARFVVCSARLLGDAGRRQVISSGDRGEARWLWGFLGGTSSAFSSIWLLIVLYKAISAHVAWASPPAGLPLSVRSPSPDLQGEGVAAPVGGDRGHHARHDRARRGGVREDREQSARPSKCSAEMST